MMEHVFPGDQWQTKSPGEVGFDGERLASVEIALKESAHKPFRFAIARYGYLIAEWGEGVDTSKQINQSSAGKSFYSCLLGIAVTDGTLPSADAKVIDYYPEMMDVGEEEGPKPGRYAFDKDRDITFRQLICNTSGYMKPGEEPGKVFHYQTFGMNILTNGLATAYGQYDSGDPGRLPGCARPMAEKVRDPIKGSWSHFYTDFEHPPGAKKNIFGHSLRVEATARDTARAGHLWLNEGSWDGEQVVPADYLKTATVTNDDIRANEPEEKWCYGH